MGNRVEDLETQVAELQAAIDGLTEELVETKERLRQLENATDLSAEAASDDGDAARDSHAEFVPNADAGSDADSGTDESAADEDGSEGSTDEEADDSDDGIIVA